MSTYKRLWFLCTILASIFSCREPATQNDPGNGFLASEAVAIDTAPSSCPYLTRDHLGNMVLSWIRAVNDSSAIACYAVSANQGKSFAKTVEIPSSRNVHPHAENMPKLVFKPSGEIIAVWGASNPNPENAYSGEVFYAQSFDRGITWTAATKLVSDLKSHDQRYFDVGLLPGGEAAIIWLDNRKKLGREGSAIYFASTIGQSGFQHERYIGESCCECCRTDLFIDSRSNIHIAYRAIINDSIRDMVHSVSDDGGKTFSVPRRLHKDDWVIRGCPHTGPVMAENRYGMHFTWYTMGNGGGLYYCSSSNNGNSFSGRDSVRSRSSARHPQMVKLPGEDIMITWDETTWKNNSQLTAIGVQKRSENGVPIFTRYITPDTLKASYPVLQAIDENSSFVAYDQTEKNVSHVVYRKLSFK